MATANPPRPSAEACQLFTRLAHRDPAGAEASAVEEAVKLCGYLPLAITLLAGRLARRPNWSITAFVEDFAAMKDRLAALAAGDRAVTAVFEMSYQELSADRQRLFRRLGLHPGTDIDIDATTALAGVPYDQARQDLDALYTDNLIEEPVRGRYRLHDLIRDYARTLATRQDPAEDRAHAVEQLLDYYLDRAEAADEHLRALPGMPVPPGFRSRQDALAWLDTERSNLIAAVSMADSTGLDHVAIQLPLSLDVYLRWRRRFDDLLAIANISVDAARRLGDRHWEGRALDNLGAVLWELRQFGQAVTACQDAVAIFREAPSDRHDLGLALTNLSIALWKMRRFEEAIIACQDAAAIFRETGDRHHEGIALTNFGAALAEVRRFEEAITACQHAAAIFRKSRDWHHEGNALTNLGAALAGVSQFEDAIAACRDAVALFQAIADRHGEGIALTNLGAAEARARRFAEAGTACQDTADQHSEHWAPVVYLTRPRWT